MVGELAAAAGPMHWKTRLDEVGRCGAGAGGVERRVLEKPDELRRLAPGDGVHPLVHGGDRAVVGDEAVAHAPLRRRPVVDWEEPACQIGAGINHLVTIPW